MPDAVNNFFKQLSQIFISLPPRRKAFVIGAILLTVFSLAALVMWANRVEYKMLYAGLTSEDSGAVVARLQEMKVPYRIGQDGNTIMVPGSMVYELRMQLASDGLPQSGGMGYEIFDKQSIGITEFVQKVNFQRAVQGELARTINQFPEVKNARVHLSLPEKSLFVDEQEQPRASVVLSLHPGRALGPSQIQGITHLVAGSIEGMVPESVIIVDAHGKLLAGGKEKRSIDNLSLTQQELQTKVEKNIEQKIETMLAGVVGPQKVTARVSVEMNFTQVEQTEENYDPDSAAVRSEQRTSEKSSGQRPIASGVPGVVSNTPDLQQAGQSGGGLKTTNYNKSDETINYEITRVTKRIVNPVGTLKRLTAAVLIDGTYEPASAGSQSQQRTYVPRTKEEMKKYEALVRQAIGYDEDREDSVEVVNVQFREIEETQETLFERLMAQIDLQELITYVVTAALFALFFVFGLRPLLRILSRVMDEVKVASQLPSVEKKELGIEVGELEPGAPLSMSTDMGGKQEQLVVLSQKNPRLFAQYLKGWMSQ